MFVGLWGKIKLLKLLNQGFVFGGRNPHVLFEMPIEGSSRIEMTVLAKGFYGIVFQIPVIDECQCMDQAH